MKSEKFVSRFGVLAGVSACVLAAMASSASATVYTVVNPGFEADNASGGDVAGATGWATVAGDAYTSSAAAHSGTQSGKAFGSPGLFQQTINATDPVGTSYTSTIYAEDLGSDKLTGTEGGFINMDFLDSSGNVLATVTGGEEGSSLTTADPTDVFKLLTVTAPSVAGTASIRIDILAGPYNGSGAGGGAVYFDDATLNSATATPEPASLALVGLVGGSLMTRRRKTRSV